MSKLEAKRIQELVSRAKSTGEKQLVSMKYADCTEVITYINAKGEYSKQVNL